MKAPKQRDKRWHLWTKTKLANIYTRRGKFYLVQMVEGERTFPLLADAQGKPVTDLASAITAAAKVAENPFVGKPSDSEKLMEKFFAAKIADGSWEETTKAGHSHIYTSFRKDLGKPVVTAAARDLQKWYDAQRERVSESSAVTYFACIASFYRWLFDERHIKHNPALDVVVKKPEPSADRAFATYEQRDKAIASVVKDDHLELFLTLGFHFGLRRREIDHARKDWVDLPNRLLRVRNLLNPPEGLMYFRVKNGKERTIPMSQHATEFFTRYLKDFPEDGHYLLHPEKKTQGKNRYRYDMQRPFKDHMKACGIPWLTIQGMRTTFASLLATTGHVTIEQIADWIGDTISTTEDAYAHLLPRHDLMEKAFRHRGLPEVEEKKEDQSGKGSRRKRATAARKSSVA